MGCVLSLHNIYQHLMWGNWDTSTYILMIEFQRSILSSRSLFRSLHAAHAPCLLQPPSSTMSTVPVHSFTSIKSQPAGASQALQPQLDAHKSWPLINQAAWPGRTATCSKCTSLRPSVCVRAISMVISASEQLIYSGHGPSILPYLVFKLDRYIPYFLKPDSCNKYLHIAVQICLSNNSSSGRIPAACILDEPLYLLGRMRCTGSKYQSLRDVLWSSPLDIPANEYYIDN